MIYKNFRISIFIRVSIIVMLALAFAFIVTKNPTLFIPMAILVALISAIIELVRYIEKSNKDLTHFLLSIRQGAFTEFYTSGKRGKQYDALSGALNDVVKEFAKLNAQKELHYQYLQALNENINVAILSFDEQGKLLMMNQAARKMLNAPNFDSIEHFKKIDPHLYEVVAEIKPEASLVIKTFVGAQQCQLIVQAKEIILQQKHVRIILLQNLNHELEAKEIEAWHQLMRVLTHEIMNSVTPIASLTNAVQRILHNTNGTRKNFNTLSQENEDDIFTSLSTIASRSQGLINFVTAYKEYSKPLELILQDVDLFNLAEKIIQFMKPMTDSHHVQIKLKSAQAKVTAKIDAAMMEQVLINIIKNAVDAVSHAGDGFIEISIGNTGTQTFITVTDNGEGITPDILPRIFIPFFTTKTKGTGIGLSLSRQIIKLHGGTIEVESTPGINTKFTIHLSQ